MKKEKGECKPCEGIYCSNQFCYLLYHFSMPNTPLPVAERILSMVASDKRPNIYHQFGIGGSEWASSDRSIRLSGNLDWFLPSGDEWWLRLIGQLPCLENGAFDVSRTEDDDWNRTYRNWIFLRINRSRETEHLGLGRFLHLFPRIQMFLLPWWVGEALFYANSITVSILSCSLTRTSKRTLQRNRLYRVC